MYTFTALKNAVKNPGKAIIEFNRLYQMGFGYRDKELFYTDGEDIMAKEWDNLILLDVSRYDTFSEISTIPGEQEKISSASSATNQFLRASLSGLEFHDTVYVTANPQFYRIQNGIYDVDPIGTSFHATIEVWQDNWDEEHRTVRPEVVAQETLKAAKKYPNKRLLVHFLQPHAPYIGPTGVSELPTDYLNFWQAYRDGEFEVDLETARKAYRENLELALPHVETLVEELPGKTAVSSDHGELLGDRDSPLPIRRFRHPSKTHLPGLIDVPWLVCSGGGRKEIVPEAPIAEDTNEDVSSEVVKERLEDLGYA